MHTKNGCLLVATFCSGLSFNTHAVVDIDAQIVQLRTSCTEQGSIIDNCFTDTVALADWLQNTRVPIPSPLSPVSVIIGPGTFSPLALGSVQSVSFKGAGPDISIIDGGGGAGVSLGSCDKVHFQDMTISGSRGGYWVGAGTSTWSNVTLIGGSDGAWYDAGPSEHRWTNSRIIGNGGIGYRVNGALSKSWFYGSEIVSINAAPSLGNFSAVYLKGEAHVYGSSIQVEVPNSIDLPSDDDSIMAAVRVDGGEMHIHGTGIDVIGNDRPNDVAALIVKNNGTIHANESSYNMRTTPSGAIKRIINLGGLVMAPYQWRQGINPPANLISEEGADTFIDLSSTDPRLMIYRSTCNNNGPWYDPVAKACR